MATPRNARAAEPVPALHLILAATSRDGNSDILLYQTDETERPARAALYG